MESIKKLMEMVLPVEWLWSLVPVSASSQAAAMDPLYYFIVWVSTLLFLLVIIPLTWFCIKYRRKYVGQKALSQKDHNQLLEITWSVGPLIFLGIVFVWGFYGFLNLYLAPLESKELKVIGQKWMWTVQYPEEEISVSGQGAIIAVPLGKPVKLVMSSQDVLHSFFIPNFRVKQDVVPGKYSTLWFEATKLGEFPVLCTEFCGDQHSAMLAMIKVMNPEDYAAWVDKEKSRDQGLSPTKIGEKLFTSKGCVACHTLDGSPRIGPSFKSTWGRTEKLTDGRSVVVNEQRIRQKLLEPAKDVTMGFPAVMPSFKGQLSEIEINGIIEFIKSHK